ncbi:hypothetical protein S1361_21035 [Streptomyces cyanogenus]|uniref:Uncharacterized protein n=1 Tax=Streptomyces cyanogenus TaxID=80860 RepID=A0ABX7TSW5_STRCY|nr:hypothetical protein S1361_21035 [Streptomyces cyanogenus]
MQGTDGRGEAYGEDPYAGAGYAYAGAYGDEYGSGLTTGTPAPAWDPVPPAQWTHPTAHPPATGPGPRVTADPLVVTDPFVVPRPHATVDPLVATDPHRPGTPLHPAGPSPAASPWGSPHGDVLTVPFPEPSSEPGTPGPPGPGPQPGASGPVRAVFVASSGRRQRQALRAARLLMIPGGVHAAVPAEAAEAVGCARGFRPPSAAGTARNHAVVLRDRDPRP